MGGDIDLEDDTDTVHIIMVHGLHVHGSLLSSVFVVCCTQRNRNRILDLAGRNRHLAGSS